MPTPGQSHPTQTLKAVPLRSQRKVNISKYLWTFVEQHQAQFKRGTGSQGWTQDQAVSAAVARMAQANPFCQANVRPASEEEVAELLYRVW